MDIPKEFMLFGQKIKVVFVDDLSHKTDDVGQARFRDNEILLQGNVSGSPMIKSRLEVVYLEEVIHFILDEMKEDKLNDDESFVKMMASCLHQIFETSEY